MTILYSFQNPTSSLTAALLPSPIGFSTYGQSIVGNLPCVQTVTTTVYSPDPSVLASITSVISASMVAASSIATPTISVIVNE